MFVENQIKALSVRSKMKLKNHASIFRFSGYDHFVLNRLSMVVPGGKVLSYNMLAIHASHNLS